MCILMEKIAYLAITYCPYQINKVYTKNIYSVHTLFISKNW